MKNNIFAKYISEMVSLDQEIRNKAMKTGERIYNYLAYLTDAVHNHKIHQLIGQYGYPTKAKVGDKAMRDFWLLVQHQDFDIELQKQCLENCDFNQDNRAFLVDRINVNEGKKQVYGTQFYRNKKGNFLSRPTEDPKNLDNRRAEAGLGSFEDYKHEFIQKHKKHRSESKS